VQCGIKLARFSFHGALKHLVIWLEIGSTDFFNKSLTNSILWITFEYRRSKSSACMSSIQQVIQRRNDSAGSGVPAMGAWSACEYRRNNFRGEVARNVRSSSARGVAEPLDLARKGAQFRGRKSARWAVLTAAATTHRRSPASCCTCAHAMLAKPRF
jgi:hypothetical protein